MRLFEVPMSGDASSIELTQDRCWQAGAAGLWEHETADGVELRVGVAPEDVAHFLEALGDLVPIDITAESAVDLAAQHRTIQVGSHRFEVVVPGTVFGNADHATTRACLDALCDHVKPGDRVLDVGCGSGVLSVAAALLGASVVAVDIDQGAVDATKANATSADAAIEVLTGSLDVVEGTFDVVLANISAGTILRLIEPVLAAVGPDGALVTSGVLDDQRPTVDAALVGFRCVSTVSVDGWTTSVHRRETTGH